MLVLPQEVEVELHGTTAKWYEEKGYSVRRTDSKNRKGEFKVDVGKVILVNVLDLPEKCNKQIEVICDYCGKHYHKSMCSYTNTHTQTKTLKDFCEDCRSKATSESLMKYTYENMVDIFNEHGFEVLLSKDKYKTSRTLVNYKCMICGHESRMNLSACILGRGCKICTREKTNEKVRNDFNYIKKCFEEKECILLSSKNDYKDKDSPLTYICHCGEENTTSFNSFKKSYYCRYCRYENIDHRKCTIEEVKQIFIDNNCVLLAKEYYGVSFKMPYICECGNESEIDLGHFLRGQRCDKCGLEKLRRQFQHPYQYVKECFEEFDCKLLSTEYKNINSLLDFECSCGNKSKITLNALLLGAKCEECMKENNNVSNNHKGLLRLSEEYMDWRKQVFERDDYTCQYCNIKGGYLNAHHLNGYNLFVEERIDIDNGITLCKIDHKNFHKIYGKKDNTKEQFEEWLLSKDKLMEVNII